MFSLLIYIFLLRTKRASGDREAYFQLEENSLLIDENPIDERPADSVLACSHRCTRETSCKGANFWKKHGKCSLLMLTRKGNSHKLLRQADCVHLEKVEFGESVSFIGSTQYLAALSCQALHGLSSPPPTGVYWIDPDGGSHANAFKAYCDMDTDGGGWTLVWSYTFTKYDAFNTGLNAVIPRPDWSVNSRVDVRISTTPPLNETDYNAVNFSVWKQIGRQVLIKSNINNWLRCDPENGSLVDWQEGAVSCKIVKHVTDTCNERVPLMFLPSKGFGPILSRSNNWGSTAYYYYDGYTRNNWPTHDPCGTNQPNQLKNILTPHGNIFIR